MEPALAAQSLAEYFEQHWFGGTASPGFAALALAAFVHVLLLGLFFGIPGGLFIWGERKIAGRIQDRLGPTRVGGKFGWLQSVADGLKLIQKEDIIPRNADPFLFRLAPYIVLAASFTAYALLPFSDEWVAVAADAGLFILFGVLALEVLGVILGGYASGSKWALYGAMREAAQMISYEIPMSLCLVVPVIFAGTLNLVEIGRLQSGWFTNWLIFNPIVFLAFVTYFTCATASCKRAPFDLAEAESELVAGFMTEYSGMRWALFFLAEYASMFLVSGVAVIVFLGGWHLGVPIPEGSWPWRFVGFCVFLIKTSMLVILQIWVRWTLPRLRIDQLMVACWKYLFPISCALLLAAALWPLLLAALLGRSTLLRSPVSHSTAPAQYSQAEAIHSQQISRIERQVSLAAEREHVGGRPEKLSFEQLLASVRLHLLPGRMAQSDCHDEASRRGDAADALQTPSADAGAQSVAGPERAAQPDRLRLDAARTADHPATEAGEGERG